jgi:single-strand DNA-binding protein
MNKVILMGRLARDPEVRYSQGATPLAVARFTLAVNRRFKREGEPDADFIGCVAFGKQGEFVERFFKKGQMVSVVGRLQVRSWDDKDGSKRWSTDVVVEETYFAESKASFEGRSAAGGNDFSAPKQQKAPSQTEGFYPIDESIEDDDLPF